MKAFAPKEIDAACSYIRLDQPQQALAQAQAAAAGMARRLRVEGEFDGLIRSW